jgi:hypothetical protein
MQRCALAIVILVTLFLPACSGQGDSATAERLAAIEAKLEKALEKAPKGDGETLARLDRRLREMESSLEDILTAMEFLAVDVDAIKRNTWETLSSMQTTGEDGEVEPPDEYRRLFDPEAREKLVELAAAKGVRLFEGRLEVDGVIVQNRAMLEFLAVVAGGKEHETVIALVGSAEYGGEMPKGLASMINACILALGFEKGQPVRASKDGKVLPPQGEPIHVYVEWAGEDGEAIRARGEDLVYNIEKKEPMSRGKWVYVGSRFERMYGSSEVAYMADLTGDVIATYSWPNTIIDNTTSEGSDDIYYTCLTPRIPEVGTKVTLVLSREEMEAKEFPSLELPEEEDDAESGK